MAEPHSSAHSGESKSQSRRRKDTRSFCNPCKPYTALACLPLPLSPGLHACQWSSCRSLLSQLQPQLLSCIMFSAKARLCLGFVGLLLSVCAGSRTLPPAKSSRGFLRPTTVQVQLAACCHLGVL